MYSDCSFAIVLSFSENIAAVAALRKTRMREVPIYLHPLDLPLYEAAGRQSELDKMLDNTGQPPPVDVKLFDGQIIAVGDLNLEVW